jgi:hypothetical protein
MMIIIDMRMTGSLKVERWKGEMVKSSPRNKPYQAIYCVIPGSDPGSSLLKTTTQP